MGWGGRADNRALADRQAVDAARTEAVSSGSGAGRLASYQKPNAQTPANATNAATKTGLRHPGRGRATVSSTVSTRSIVPGPSARSRI
jgi:hypothetical protein